MPYAFKTTKERSQIMQKIKSTDTKPEILFRKALWAKGIRFRKNNNSLPGKPDIVIANCKVAVFVDGEFWHGYRWEEKKKKIKNNRAYWIPKIERNIARDKQNNKKLKKAGWQVIRLWQHQVIKDLPGCIQKIKKTLK